MAQIIPLNGALTPAYDTTLAVGDDDTVPAIFLGKDGTLLEQQPDPANPEHMRFAPGVARGLARLAELGCPLVVVSNQPGVAEGRFTEHALRAVERRLREMFEHVGATLSAFYWCPHGNDDQCNCRKPAPGLVEQAALQLGIDLQRSWMIGDILDDIEAGHRAGCRSVLIDNGTETGWDVSGLRAPQLFAADFAIAADMILSRWSATERAR